MKESRYNKINIKDKIFKNKKILIIILVLIISISIDQIIKAIVVNNLYKSSTDIFEGVLSLTYIENTGGAFGIGSNSIIMFIIVNIIVIAITARFLLLKKEHINNHILISLALILSGGIGNLIDRIFRGHVIDYIDFNALIKYPVFNFADICVVVGCAIIIISIICSTRTKSKD
ncbi:MAG: signal peptidase II [Clostridia bacterium]|nr:signal peptidase II [Clostridia bacterium]